MAPLSLFTADLDETTAPLKRRDIASARALLALSVLLVLLFWGGYWLMETSFVDPLWGRVLFALVPAAGLALSYLSEAARERFLLIWRGFLYATVAWFTGLSALNQFAPAYTLGLFFVVAVTSAAFGVGLRRQKSYVPFLAFSVLVPGAAAAGLPVWGAPPMQSLPIFLTSLVSLAIISYLVLGWRVRVEQTLRQRRREAQAASRLKSSIIDNMSHELRTPLTSILGFAEALEMELSGRPREMAASIRKSGDRLQRTLEVLLTLSSLEAGEAGFDPEWVDVGRRVEETVQGFVPRAREKGLGLEVHENQDATDEASRAYVDPSLIDRTVRVLVDNAIKFTEEGHVAVTVHVREEQLQLTVEDTGIGMEAPEELFEPFRQGSEGIDREHEGLGLGLSLVGQFVELMGGDIEVESERGAGTRIEVHLPRVQPDSS